MELDQARPSCDFATIQKFYESDFKLDTSSSTTYSSTRSNKVNDIKSYDSDSSTLSNSDTEELELDAISNEEEFSKYQNDLHKQNQLRSQDGNLVLVNHGDRSVAQATGPTIETVAIQNSSDIQFGNKTFYNGPVTIKQFLFDEKNSKWISRSNGGVANIENGAVNKGFDGEIMECSNVMNRANPRRKVSTYENEAIFERSVAS